MNYRHYLLGDSKTASIKISWETKEARINIEDSEQCVSLSYLSTLDSLEKDLKTVLNDIGRWRKSQETK